MSSSFSCSVQLCRPQASTYSSVCSLNSTHSTKDIYLSMPISTDTNPVITSMKRSSKHLSITEACSLMTSSSDSIVNWHGEQGEDTGESNQHQSTSLVSLNKMQNQKAFSSFSRAFILPQACVFLKRQRRHS